MVFNVKIEALERANVRNTAIVSFTLAYLRICSKMGVPFSYADCYNDFIEAHGISEDDLSYGAYYHQIKYWTSKSKIPSVVSPILQTRILQIIKTIRESFIGSCAVYENGYFLFKILESVFADHLPCAYVDQFSRVVTKIGDHHYNIDGVVTGVFTPLLEEDERLFQNRKFVMQLPNKS